CCARRARVEGCRLRRGDDHDERLQAGVVQGSRRQRAHAPSEVRRVITVEKVDFIGIPVAENATGDAWFGETLGLWERNPRSNERWVEFEAPNVTVALVPEAYKPGDHVPLPYGAF